MKRYKFRLERLLGLRTAAERERARLFGRAEDAAAIARRVAAASAQLEREAEEQVARALSGAVPAGLAANLGAARDRIAGRHDADQAASCDADRARDAALDDYRAAHRGRRVLERLSEIRREAHQLEQGREERRDMDEIASRVRLEGLRP